MRRAASTTSWPFSAKICASAVPIPDEAPVISATGLRRNLREIRPAVAVLSISIDQCTQPRPLPRTYHGARRAVVHIRDTNDRTLPHCRSANPACRDAGTV